MSLYNFNIPHATFQIPIFFTLITFFFSALFPQISRENVIVMKGEKLPKKKKKKGYYILNIAH